MANQLRNSYINPIRTYDLNHVNDPKYASQFMDDFSFEDTIKPWQQDVSFCTKWLKADTISVQYETNYTPLTIKVLKTDGQEIYSQPFVTKQQNFFDPAFFIRQAEIDLSSFDYGCYVVKTIAGSSLVLVSEKIEVCESLPHTLLLEYSHYERYQNVIFVEAEFEPMIRIPATLRYLKTPLKSTVYEDQPLNETMVKAIPYRVFELIIGGSVGIPPWLIDKVSRIFGCSDVRIDGRHYTKNGEGAEFEANELENYPMAGWRIELRPKYNRDGLIIEDDVAIAGAYSAAAVIGTKGFGTEVDDYETINDVE